MDKKRFFQQKVVQAFHDPPGKPYGFFPNSGGHRKLAQRLFKQFTGKDFKFHSVRPDLAASGADRPVVNVPRGEKGGFGTIQFHRDGNNLVTHPLSQGCNLRLPHSKDTTPLSRKDIEKLFRVQEDALKRLWGEPREVETSTINQPGATEQDAPFDWEDPDALKKGFIGLWRLFRDYLVQDNPEEGLLWERIPADTRVPDHSIWEHLKITSALAFLDTKTDKVPQEKEPWLFSLALNPVQEFIEESRTSRDLWISSFLIADLAWHAMLPIVEHYGPDVIVYPDLRANPRVDNWLYHAYPDLFPEDFPYPATHAAVLPHTFTAILPRGGVDYLLPIQEVALKAAQGMQDRWKSLAKGVRTWLSRELSDSTWEEIWERQHESVFACYWTAVWWQVPGRVESSEEFVRLTEGGALPVQDRTKLPPPTTDSSKVAQDREDRLGVWMPSEVWAHYERARSVFGRVNLPYVQNERGFDYALTHHELRMRQRIRKQEAHYGPGYEEPGEKCTQCRKREALFSPKADYDDIDSRRAQVRMFWQEIWNKRREPDTTDRLCAVCTFKRFLVDAGDEAKGFNVIWKDPDADWEDSDGKVRFPFPSTSAVAAQTFLASVAKSTKDNPKMRQAVEKVIRTHGNASLRATMFPRTLPMLREASKVSSLAEQFLKLDPQETIFPDALQTQIDRARQSEKSSSTSSPRKSDALSHLKRAVHELHEAAANCDPRIDPPDSHIALVRLDGDNIGRLLIGDAQAVRAKWRDLIHPRAVSRLEENDAMRSAGWPSLLDAPRLMGPSLHAFISRTLADFSHRIAPWVVEREYGGRLIYAGGDDVLAIAPARDALRMAARLQQLFAANWIIDTLPNERPWDWRSGQQEWITLERARWRFVIPQPPEPEKLEERKPPAAIDLPVQEIERAIGVSDDAPEDRPFDGKVLAGMGRYQSLSASIVYGHFKTQLSTMLREGRRLLDETAKGELSRGGVAMSHRSRGGWKSEIALKWNMDEPERRAYYLVGLVLDAFRGKDRPRGHSLPGRLPYKLREVAPLLLLEENLTWPNDLAKGLLVKALDGTPLDGRLLKALLALWKSGYELHVKRAQARASLHRDALRQAAERSVDGLLLCRYLAGQGAEN